MRRPLVAALGFVLGAACHAHGQGNLTDMRCSRRPGMELEGHLEVASQWREAGKCVWRCYLLHRQQGIETPRALHRMSASLRGREDGHPALPNYAGVAQMAEAADSNSAQVEVQVLPPAPALTVELRMGGMVVFGAGAPAGTAPFADLRTVTRLSTSARPWRLTTQTQLTAAPGTEFDVAEPDTWQTLDFGIGLAVPLKSAWNVSGFLECGAQARVFRADAIERPTARRCGVGILVQSTTAAHLSLVLAYDERLHGWGALVGATVDVAPSLGFVGSALVGRTITLRLAAVVKWAPTKGKP